ncbi:PepSY domain-containing protein [Pseudohongiella sp. SYSU M77423]|uniref:PepSY domain-containing protein n=1 Tax=Pseudohongiella sp. SYSU M77423 TaxID=3042312 RepID=UPI00247FE587|nr:PepSY domain-containing protein [Pseudohongiella sp. SYSU M77423]MDH7944650.1 PepSY domain-containing protein [Pseudohongiella sp. SYSU M77423]
MRYILITHRYLAVAVGLLMSLWCLSGFVMMYQAFPEQTLAQRLQGLAPLDLQECCDLSSLAAVDSSVAPPFRIEMLLDDPVMRTPAAVINLRTGQPITLLGDAELMQVARLWAEGNNLQDANLSLQGELEMDQWIIQSARRNRPVHHVLMGDRAGTEIYINGSTGEVFQKTTRRERVLAWLGVIPHWLYPTALRQNGALWSEIVIWTSIAGTFLTATGLYVGIARLRTRRARRDAGAQPRSQISPFRGLWYWHHMLGLVFGILTLTWVFSGLLTMNPWGALAGDGSSYRQDFVGDASWQQVRNLLRSATQAQQQGELPQNMVSLQSGVFAGDLHAFVGTADGEQSLRIDATARPAEPLTESVIRQHTAAAGVPLESLRLLTEEDAYYYAHKSPIELPVLRAQLIDSDNTAIYIGPESASVRVMTETSRTSRWLRVGLHRLDFAFMKDRPLWDILVIILLAGVTLLCLTGTWMSFQRIRHDMRSARQQKRRAF